MGESAGCHVSMLILFVCVCVCVCILFVCFVCHFYHSRENLLSHVHVEAGQVKILKNSIAILVSALVTLKPSKYEN